MGAGHSRSGVALATVALAACLGRTLAAQGVEVTPFGGYRFGGDFFELLAAHQLDRDGAVSLGVAVDIPFSEATQFEAVYTRERADLIVLAIPSFATTSIIEHWLAGGLTELQGGRVRPFLTGLVGLTRYATDADSEIRVAVSAGGGVKLFPSAHVGVRLDGRAFTTIVDAGGHFYACAPGRTCVLAIHADVVWQAEFTTGVVFRFR